MQKISAEEQLITERIFQLNISLGLLKRASLPFHKEAIQLVENKIKHLKNGETKQNSKRDHRKS